MNSHISTLKTLTDLTEKMRAAGFTDGSFYEFVRNEPCIRFGNAKEGLLYKLYLAYLGLAEFTLKPSIIQMFVSEKYSDEEYSEFVKGGRCEFIIHNEDRQFFVPCIDLTRLDIMTPFVSGEKTITLEEGIRRVYSSDSVEIANYWHMEWLHHHRDFIPELWKKVLKNGGRIIFPRVRLVSVSFHGEQTRILYPYFCTEYGNEYVIVNKYNLQSDYGDDRRQEKLCRGKDFFACFRKIEKKKK